MYLGMDIGGTKTLIAFAEKSDTSINHRRIETAKKYEDFLNSVSEEINNFEHVINGAGVGVPGKIDRENGTIIAGANLNWKNKPIAKDLSRIIKAPVVIENDAKLAALSESKTLEKQFNKCLYLTISTGIGAGVVMNGKLVDALRDCEIGSSLYVKDGQPERWERFASGKAISERYNTLAENIPQESIKWDQISEDLSYGIFNILALVQPDVIIVGGGVGNYLERFKDRLEIKLKTMENDLVNIPPIIKAQNPDGAVLAGALELAFQHYQEY